MRHAGAVLLLATLSVSACGPREGEVALVNNSGERVTTATVSVCGQRLPFGMMYDGERAHKPFLVSCEGHFTIEATLQSGETLTADVGYVTPGMIDRHNFQIASNGIREMGTAFKR